MTAETIANALGGRRAWIARCPANDCRTRSFSIRDAEDKKMLVRCHAGCRQGRAITVIPTRGLWAENSPHSLSKVLIAGAIVAAENIPDPLDNLVEKTVIDCGVASASEVLKRLVAMKKHDRAETEAGGWGSGL
jgi:hypothetical protein